MLERAPRARAAETGASTVPSYSTRVQGVASQRPRPGDDAFLKGSVACIASAPRVELSSALATAVVVTTSVLLTSERPTSRHEDALSVEAAWARMDCTSYAGQTRVAPTLALVKALRQAHDEAPDPAFSPTPGEELAERNRGKQRCSSRRDRRDRNRGGGGSGGGGQNVFVATTTTVAGVTATVVEAGEERRVLVAAPGAAKRRNRARTNRGGGRSSAGDTERRRNSARGPSA